MKKKKNRKVHPSFNEDILSESRRLRIRRTFQLANHCISNIAAYKANWRKNAMNESELVVERDFWKRANGNFLDIAVLEWCKVFSEKNGEHHWSRIFKHKQEWMREFCQYMNMSQKEFHAELQRVVKYRNKYVAHLQPIPMKYPSMDFLLKSVSYLYGKIHSDALTKDAVIDYGFTAAELFTEQFKRATAEVHFAEKHTEEFFDCLHSL
jgi:hypothetical protein